MSTTYVVGPSDLTEAEYSFRSEAPFTIITMVNDEVLCVEGFQTFKAALADLEGVEHGAAHIVAL